MAHPISQTPRVLRPRIGVTLLLVVGTIALNSCSGFQSVSPDPYQIMVLRNPNVRAQSSKSKFLTTPAPLPTPEISAKEFQRIAKLPPASGVTTTAAIPPINIGPDSVISTAAGQVVTQQANYQADPMSAAGQLFFTRANGTSHYCTAEFVGATDVILAAGHCVYDSTFGGGTGTGWDTTLEFDYANGSTTPGPSYFDWNCIAIFSGWALNNPGVDFAFIKTNSAGPRALGLDQSAATLATNFGYPANISSTIISYVNGNISLGGSNILAHSPDSFDGGASGGAWVGTEYAWSVNSFTQQGVNNVIYGPLFTSKTIQLFQYVAAGCPASTQTAQNQSVKMLSANPATTAPVSHDALAVLSGSSPLVRQVTASLSQSTTASLQLKLSNACKCANAMPLVVTNETGHPRRIVAALSVRNSNELSKEYSVDLDPHESRNLSCSIEGTVCTSVQSLEIKSSVRLRNSGHLKAALTQQQPMVPVSIDMCVDRCAAGDAAWCQRLGARPASALQPLRSLVTASAGVPDKNGIALKKNTIIKAFGGDPEKMMDPCGRSDIVRFNDTISNSGNECTVRSPNLVQNHQRNCCWICR